MAMAEIDHHQAQMPADLHKGIRDSLFILPT
jgi:hypothetical protein